MREIISRMLQKIFEFMNCLIFDNFVDFKSSKLSFVLRPYLTGQGRALFVVTASQERKHLAATKAVFNFMDVINEINLMNQVD